MNFGLKTILKTTGKVFKTLLGLPVSGYTSKDDSHAIIHLLTKNNLTISLLIEIDDTVENGGTVK